MKIPRFIFTSTVLSHLFYNKLNLVINCFIDVCFSYLIIIIIIIMTLFKEEAQLDKSNLP